MKKIALFVVAAVLYACLSSRPVASMPKAQQEASSAPSSGGGLTADDLLDAAKDAQRYGQNVGEVDSDFLAEIFGAPSGIVEDNKYDNCSYYAPDGYSCVPYYNCKQGYIITDGGGLFDIRSGLLDDVQLDPEASKCESYLEVCCRSQDFAGVPPPTRPPRPTTAAPITRPPQPEKYRARCGRRNHGGIGVRIQNAGGAEGTQFGEWPHMCAILDKAKVGSDEVNLYVCGASLIAPGIVMTGAHCVNQLNTSTLKVRCGEWDTRQTIEPLRHEDRSAKHISIHPGFNPLNLQNDFALVHLSTPFVLSSHIDTICLPNQYEGPNSYYKRNCVATGWGKDEFGSEGMYQVILKQVEMDMVNHDTCQDRFRQTRLGPNFVLDRSFVCAGGQPGKDTCKGDGGGPLVCPSHPCADGDQQQYVQSGIVAWGIGCGGNIPGAYANVSAALCFIDWATRCVEGQDADFYDFQGCRHWAKREYCGYQQRIAELDNQVRISGRNLVGSLRNERIMLESLLAPFEAAISSCQSGNGDLDCSVYDYGDDFYGGQDFDIASLARSSQRAQYESECGGGGSDLIPKTSVEGLGRILEEEQEQGEEGGEDGVVDLRSGTK